MGDRSSRKRTEKSSWSAVGARRKNSGRCGLGAVGCVLSRELLDLDSPLTRRARGHSSKSVEVQQFSRSPTAHSPKPMAPVT